jgi:hypothetical protein
MLQRNKEYSGIRIRELGNKLELYEWLKE